MKILYLNPSSEIGGGEKSLLELISALDRSTWQPHAVCLSEGPLPRALRAMDVPVEIVPWPAFALRVGRGTLLGRALAPLATPAVLPHVMKVARIVRREGIGIVHTNGLKSHLVGSLVRMRTGCRLVWHVRDVLQEGMVRAFFQRAAALSVDRLVANSRSVAATFPALDGSRLSVIYNGLDTESYRPGPGSPEVRSALGAAAGDFMVGAIGALAPLKGHIHLIRAAPAILEAHPDTRFAIVGAEMYVTVGHRGYRDLLEEEVRRLGLTDRFVFAGYRSDSVEVLRALDLLVHSSIYPESFGRVIVEAMACGVPVVATALGGPTEIIRSDIEGSLIPAEDPAAIAQAVIALRSDPERRAAMREAGRRRAVEDFGIARYGREVQELYAALARGQGPAA